MQNSQKRLATALAALALAIIGSALWEFAVRPAATSAAGWMVQHIAARSEAFERELVRDIARGPSDYAAVSMYAGKTSEQFLFMIVGLMLIAVAYFKTRLTGMLKDQGINSDRAAIAGVGIILTFLGVMTASPVAAARAQMVSAFVSHFEQSKRVIAPYMSEQQLRVVESRFARMETWEDYKRIIAEISAAAAPHGVRLPNLKLFGTNVSVDRIFATR